MLTSFPNLPYSSISPKMILDSIILLVSIKCLIAAHIYLIKRVQKRAFIMWQQRMLRFSHCWLPYVGVFSYPLSLIVSKARSRSQTGSCMTPGGRQSQQWVIWEQNLSREHVSSLQLPLLMPVSHITSGHYQLEFLRQLCVVSPHDICKYSMSCFYSKSYLVNLLRSV